MLEFTGHLVATDTWAVTIARLDCFCHVQPALPTEPVALLTLSAPRAALPAPDLTQLGGQQVPLMPLNSTSI